MRTAPKPSPTDDLDVGTSEADLRAFLSAGPSEDQLTFQLKASVALVALLRRILALEAELLTQRATA